jgi:hypothetical protein
LPIGVSSMLSSIMIALGTALKPVTRCWATISQKRGSSWRAIALRRAEQDRRAGEERHQAGDDHRVHMEKRQSAEQHRAGAQFTLESRPAENDDLVLPRRSPGRTEREPAEALCGAQREFRAARTGEIGKGA